MKKTIHTILFLFILFNLYSQVFKKDKIINNPDESLYNIIGVYDKNEYISIYKNKIFLIDFLGKSRKELIEGKFHIFFADYYNKVDKVLYIAGYGDVAAPFIFDVKLKSKRILMELTYKNNLKEIFYKTFRTIYWIDSENILYEVFNPETLSVDINIYNLNTGENLNILSHDNLGIYDFNMDAKQFIYSIYDEKGMIFRIYDLTTNSDILLGKKEYHNIKILKKNIFVCFFKTAEAKYEIDYYNNSILEKIDNPYNIMGCFFYDELNKIAFCGVQAKKKHESYYVGIFDVNLK